MSHVLISVLWSVYFAVHSILASTKLKVFIYRQIPNSKQVYRIFYNLIAVGSLIPLAIYSFPSKEKLLFQSFNSQIAAYAFILFGLLITVIAFKAFNIKEFFGILQYEKSEYKPDLTISGLYKYVRHPLYFGTILLFIGLFFLYPSSELIVINVIVFIYLIIGSRLEEKKLVDEFGSQYLTYKKEVKGLIPFII
jgi:protein-S-isoprenylcysteine O-methyltransferase Ste14